ncbi:chemotaxis protein CheW [Pseudoduganella aquatica]|uniref:chemotaxis protein CheW n=1 Tax=Pseudoduganella aquatica TaxID=2660641 RepID=UPI001E319F05|nr:chemotaxis protein CheW [Pseudoduganella aquatica]
MTHVSAGAPQGAPALGAEPRQYLTFMLGGEIYAIGILAVKEIIEYAGLTSVPMMPEAIRGVINLRGAVVPVMDLAARFGREASVATKRTCIIIVEVAQGGEQQVIGVMVDAVNAVLEIAAADIEPAPSFGARIRSDFIAGMGKVNGKFVILLDASQVLSVDEISALAGVGERALAVEA